MDKMNERFYTSAQAQFTGTPKCEHLEHRIQVENAEVRVTVIPNPTCNNNQAKILSEALQELDRLDSNLGNLDPRERVKAVVNLCQNQSNVIRLQNLEENYVSDALDIVDEQLTNECGVDARVTGTFATRIRSMGTALLRAYQANKAWAKLQPDNTSRTEVNLARERCIKLECQNDELRREREKLNQDKKDLQSVCAIRASKIESADSTIAHLERQLSQRHSECVRLEHDLQEARKKVNRHIGYKESVTASHNLLTEIGVDPCGDVTERLKSFLGTVRHAIGPVSGYSKWTLALWEMVKNF